MFSKLSLCVRTCICVNVCTFVFVNMNTHILWFMGMSFHFPPTWKQGLLVVCHLYQANWPASCQRIFCCYLSFWYRGHRCMILASCGIWGFELSDPHTCVASLKLFLFSLYLNLSISLLSTYSICFLSCMIFLAFEKIFPNISINWTNRSNIWAYGVVLIQTTT